MKWADEFERIRAKLYELWLGRADSPRWSPKCELVVHAAAATYLQAAGRGQAATFGFSTFEIDGCKVVFRRIDIRADQPGWCAGALGHELTHLVMAEAFADCQLPVWADEGMALLADPLAKQELHLRDFRAAHERNEVCPLTKFLSNTSYPCRENFPVFYGQSLSLVQYLVGRKSPAEFVRFLKHAGQNGYDSALKTCYGLDGVADLEKQWRKSLTGALLTRF